MLPLIVRRLLLTIPMLAVVSFLVFGLVVLVPGNAAETLAGGANATPTAVKAISKQLHLDDPFLAQYGRWISGVVHGDFGHSLITKQSVAEQIGQRLPVTLEL